MFIQIVDCEWDSWQVGECTKECGGGKRTNTRPIKTGAEHGGRNCSGHSQITEDCNIQECPGITNIPISINYMPYIEHYMKI